MSFDRLPTRVLAHLDPLILEPYVNARPRSRQVAKGLAVGVVALGVVVVAPRSFEAALGFVIPGGGAFLLFLMADLALRVEGRDDE